MEILKEFTGTPGINFKLFGFGVSCVWINIRDDEHVWIFCIGDTMGGKFPDVNSPSFNLFALTSKYKYVQVA